MMQSFTKKGIASAEEVRNRQSEPKKDQPSDNWDALLGSAETLPALDKVGRDLAESSVGDGERARLRDVYSRRREALTK